MLIRHSLLYFAAKLFPAVATLCALALFTRWLTPASYGVYALNIAAAMGMNAVLFQWYSLALARFLPELNSTQQQD